MEHAYVVLSILYNGVQVCVCVCVCVCVWVCSFPGETSCLQRSQRRWQMTTRSLVSLICDPLRRHQHFREISCSFFLSSPRLSPLLSFSTLLCCFFSSTVSNSSLLSALLFVLSHRPPLLSCSLYNFLLIFLARVFASQTISSCVPVSLSLSLFPTVIHDLPAD